MNRKNAKITDLQARKLLRQIQQQADESVIIPLSNEEVEAIEAEFQPVSVSREMDERQLEHLEMLRQEWLRDVQSIDSIIARAKAVDLNRQALVDQLRLSADILLKLDYRLISNVPSRLITMLGDKLQLDAQSLYAYFALPPKQMQQMAAFSKEKPTDSRTQTWQEAVQTSNMSEDDKHFWQTES